MHRITALLSLTIALASCVHQPTTHFKSFDEKSVVFTTDAFFSVNAAADGTVSASAEKLSFMLNRVTLRPNAKAINPIHVNSFRVGLAVATSGSPWRVSRWSKRTFLNKDIAPGESLELTHISGDISLRDISSLSGRWLVLEVQEAFMGTLATNYAHSSRQMFADEDSRDGM